MVQKLYAPVATIVGVDPSHGVPGSEEEHRAVEALRAGFEPSAPGSDDPWREVLGVLLDREEVQRLLGLESGAAVDRLVRERRLLALPTPGSDVVYPGFQFSDDDQPYPAISAVIAILAPVVATPYTIASWLLSPRRPLGGETPIGWLKRRLDPNRVIAEAGITAAHLAD